MLTSESATRILLVEDDRAIAEPLLFGLQSEGFEVVHASDGEQALELARAREPALILLDVMLPRLDGFTVLKRLRLETRVPILMLTARSQEMDRVMGLELGADDYIVKPFSFRELLARVHANLRRRQLDRGETPALAARLTVGDLSLDREARLAWRENTPLELTAREFDLLVVLLENCGRALSRQDLLDRVWGEEWIGDTRTLDVHIRWLRERVEEDPSAPRYIQTVRGHGYRLVNPYAPADAS